MDWGSCCGTTTVVWTLLWTLLWLHWQLEGKHW
jgi:hypothetical protein